MDSNLDLNNLGGLFSLEAFEASSYMIVLWGPLCITAIAVMFRLSLLYRNPQIKKPVRLFVLLTLFYFMSAGILFGMAGYFRHTFVLNASPDHTELLIYSLLQWFLIIGSIISPVHMFFVEKRILSKLAQDSAA